MVLAIQSVLRATRQSRRTQASPGTTNPSFPYSNTVLPLRRASRRELDGTQQIKAWMSPGQVEYQFPDPSLWTRVLIQQQPFSRLDRIPEVLYKISVEINPKLLFETPAFRAEYAWLTRQFTNPSDQGFQRKIFSIKVEYLFCPFSEHFIVQKPNGEILKRKAVIQTTNALSSIAGKNNTRETVHMSGSAISGLNELNNNLLWHILREIQLPAMFPIKSKRPQSRTVA